MQKVDWILQVLQCKNKIYKTGRTQRVDENNGVIGLFTIFTPRVIAIQIQKNGSFFVFFDNNNKSAKVWTK